MLTVQEVLNQTTFAAVFAEFQKQYDAKYKMRIRAVFDAMKAARPTENRNNMVLFIRALREEADGDSTVLEAFDANDTTIYFDVCGEDSEYDGLYSIASSEYADLLGFYVSDQTVQQFTAAQIIAHILWELDW